MRVMFTRRTNGSLAGPLRCAGFAVDAQVMLDPDQPGSTGLVFASRSTRH